MSYYTQAENGTNEKSSSRYGWVIIVVVVIVVILLLIGLGIWLFRRDRQEKLLIANGVVFNVPSDGTIQATWTSTNNSNDELVLYVIPSEQQMTFNAAGVPQGSYLNSGTPSPSTAGSIPTTTPSSARATSVSGLEAGTYTAILVVTNPNINDKSYTQTSKALPVKEGDLPVVFSITAAGQTGAIRYEPSSMPTEVGYEFGKIATNNMKFHNDSDGRLCTSNAGSWTSTSMCDVGSRVLYSSTDNVLEIGVRPDTTSGDVSPITSDNSEWIYINGKWCLKNDQTRCMFLDRTNPKTELTTLSTPLGEDAPTIQKITVSTSADVNKWTNQQITS